MLVILELSLLIIVLPIMHVLILRLLLHGLSSNFHHSLLMLERSLSGPCGLLLLEGHSLILHIISGSCLNIEDLFVQANGFRIFI